MIEDRDRLCRAIVEGSADGVIVGDREGRIVLWNRGAEEIFGHPAAEVLGTSMDLIIPEKLRARHWDGYRKTMGTGVTRYGKELLAVPAIRRDGSRISIEFTIVMLRDDAGRPEGVAAVVRDVTARFLRDRELKERVAEMEKRLAGS